MIDELKAIAIFAEIVNRGSFRAAAKAMGLSPSVVSYHLSRLEERTGSALLYRSTRKLTLTHEGKELFKHASAMLNSAQNGLDAISSNNPVPSGKITLALPAVLTRAPITKKIAEFATLYPDIELTITSSDERQNLIGEGIDLALRIGHLKDCELKAKPLFSIKRQLVCASGYWQKKNATHLTGRTQRLGLDNPLHVTKPTDPDKPG